MNETKKIRVEALEQLQRDVEKIPRCEVEEVPRAIAGRKLVPQIRALRAKGYSLEAISEIFTERGVPIPATSLASYLKEARRASSRSKAKSKPEPAVKEERASRKKAPALPDDVVPIVDSSLSR